MSIDLLITLATLLPYLGVALYTFVEAVRKTVERYAEINSGRAKNHPLLAEKERKRQFIIKDNALYPSLLKRDMAALEADPRYKNLEPVLFDSKAMVFHFLFALMWPAYWTSRGVQHLADAANVAIESKAERLALKASEPKPADLAKVIEFSPNASPPEAAVQAFARFKGLNRMVTIDFTSTEAAVYWRDRVYVNGTASGRELEFFMIRNEAGELVS